MGKIGEDGNVDLIGDIEFDAVEPVLDPDKVPASLRSIEVSVGRVAGLRCASGGGRR